MADDKKKDDAEKEGGKKKGLPPIVLVAVGAALGGAGVVFFGPQPEPVEQHEPSEPKPEFKLFEHPDIVKMSFNPRQERGAMGAQVEFQFVYKADANHAKEVVEEIKTHWNLMHSRVLLRLSRETPKGLRDPENIPILEADLIREISMSLFPSEKAVVTQILWRRIYVQ
ncbi:MAG: hypothetical protein KDB80_13855 [Planctomycetes bacterium]|nr:hypothetical protein [Planctomycetota bacterium]